MAQVMQRQKTNGIAKILPMAGQVVGTIYGGPTGGAIGGAVGGAVGGMVQKPQQQSVASSDSSAVSRRMETMQSDPVNVLAESKQALAYMPADVKQQYQKPIDDAYELALKQRQNKQTGVV